jgi:hypothetical protein
MAGDQFYDIFDRSCGRANSWPKGHSRTAVVEAVWCSKALTVAQPVAVHTGIS